MVTPDQWTQIQLPQCGNQQTYVRKFHNPTVCLSAWSRPVRDSNFFFLKTQPRGLAYIHIHTYVHCVTETSWLGNTVYFGSEQLSGTINGEQYKGNLIWKPETIIQSIGSISRVVITYGAFGTMWMGNTVREGAKYLFKYTRQHIPIQKQQCTIAPQSYPKGCHCLYGLIHSLSFPNSCRFGSNCAIYKQSSPFQIIEKNDCISHNTCFHKMTNITMF